MARKTEQRKALREVFEHTTRPLTAQEALDAAQLEVPSLGIATVYRNLKVLIEEDWLQPVELPGEPTRYERSALAHHHHFHCSVCQRVFDVPGCHAHVEDLAPPGYHVTHHEIVLYGICPECT